jgi:hypothetical protein
MIAAALSTMAALCRHRDSVETQWEFATWQNVRYTVGSSKAPYSASAVAHNSDCEMR